MPCCEHRCGTRRSTTSEHGVSPLATFCACTQPSKPCSTRKRCARCFARRSAGVPGAVCSCCFSAHGVELHHSVSCPRHLSTAAAVGSLLCDKKAMAAVGSPFPCAIMTACAARHCARETLTLGALLFRCSCRVRLRSSARSRVSWARRTAAGVLAGGATHVAGMLASGCRRSLSQGLRGRCVPCFDAMGELFCLVHFVRSCPMVPARVCAGAKRKQQRCVHLRRVRGEGMDGAQPGLSG